MASNQRDLSALFTTLERIEPSRRTSAWVVIPRLIVTNRGCAHESPCPACLLNVLSGAADTAVTTLTYDQRAALGRGRGVPLKTMLTVCRWARRSAHLVLPSTPAEAADLDLLKQILYALYRNSSREPLEKIAQQVFGVPGGSPADRAQSRAVREGVRVLLDAGLIARVPGGGRAVPNAYTPHRIEPTFRVPARLWRRGWITRLRGISLLLLLNLYVAFEEQRRLAARLRGYSAEVANRGAYVVDDIESVVLPVSPNTAPAAVYQLREAGLISAIRTRKRRLTALVDPELITSAF